MCDAQILRSIVYHLTHCYITHTRSSNSWWLFIRFTMPAASALTSERIIALTRTLTPGRHFRNIANMPLSVQRVTVLIGLIRIFTNESVQMHYTNLCNEKEKHLVLSMQFRTYIFISTKTLSKKYLQELKTKLAEEVSRMRFFITGQRSDVTLGSTASEIEVWLQWCLFVSLNKHQHWICFNVGGTLGSIPAQFVLWHEIF